MRPKRYGGCFLIGHIGWFDRHTPVFRHAFVLGMSTQNTTVYTKNPVTFFIEFYIFAYCFYFTGKLSSKNSYFWFQDSKIQSCWNPKQFWCKGEISSVTVRACYCCRVYFYQHFIVLGDGFFHLFELKFVRWAEFCV